MTLPGTQRNPSPTANTSSNIDVKSNSPNASPQSSPRLATRNHHNREPSVSSSKDILLPDVKNQTELVGTEANSNSQEPLKEKRSQEKIRKKTPWYSALYPSYKSRSDDFKRIFKEIPDDERLVVDYSCAIQKDILVHGRLYVSQNYLSFYANILLWETQLVLKWKDVTAITKEKTALVIPNAILVHTHNEKHFFTSFAARDKSYLMLFRVWQNALMDRQMSAQEMWQLVHACYGDELGLTSEDDDYFSPSAPDDDQNSIMAKSVDNALFVFAEDANNSGGEKDSSSERMLPMLHELPTSGTDHVPTDMSDSSISESESEKNRSIICCPITHEGRLMVHMQVSIHVDQLFALLFTNSKFFSELHENRKSTDVKQSAWVKVPSTNEKERTVSLTIQLAQAIGPKHAHITESQKMLPCCKPGELYVIEVEASNAGIPYAEAFYIVNHYCLTRGSDAGTSNVAVYSQIKYRKSVWGLVKTYIEKNCWTGMEEYFSQLVNALESECERTRRAMAAGAVGTKRKGRRRRNTIKPMPLPSPALEEKPLIQPLPIPAQPQQNNQADSLTWIVFLVLFLLLVFNAALYYKLWGLEQTERILNEPPPEINLESFKVPENEEEWRNLLHQQEQLHSYEINRWLRILKASVHLLQQVEHSLKALQNSIQGVMDENIYSIMKEGGSSNGRSDL